MGLVVPSASAPIPVDWLLLLAAAAATTSELLELHIRHEWVRRSGAAGTDTDHSTNPAQPNRKGEEPREQEGES